MTQALATLSIDLIAKVATLQQTLDQAGRMHAKHAAEVEARYQRLAAFTQKAFGAIGGAAFVSQLTGFVDQTATAAVSMERLAKLSGAGTVEFQKLAFGAKTVGIESDKLADIFKDVQDKVGDFLQTGGGPMKDFFEQIAPKVGVTAKQFRTLSGADALQLYVSSLQKANVSQSEMVFYLEALANDATLLLPLLRNNGAEFKRLGDEAERAGKIISEEAIKNAKEYRAEMDKLSATLGGIGQKFAVSVLPEITKTASAFDDWIRSIRDSDSVLKTLVKTLATFSPAGTVMRSYEANFGPLFQRDPEAELARLLENQRGARSDNRGSYEPRIQALREEIAARREAAFRQFRVGEKDFGPAAPGPLSALPKTGKDGKDGKGGKEPKAPGQAIRDAFAGQLQRSLGRESITDFGYLTTAEDALRGFNDQQQRLFDLIKATPSSQLEQQRADMKLLADAFLEGRFGIVGSTEAIEKFNEAARTRLGTISEDIKPEVDRMSVIFEEFQRNIQDSLGTTIKSTLSGDFKSITRLWGNMLLEMASQAIAADIGQYLFPKGGSGGGVSGIFAAITSLFGFARGGAFANGMPVTAFASGGVVGSPTMFPMRGGLGLMGEAGPEAIMPLRRGRDGRLGVAASGGAAAVTNNTYNVQAGVTRNELVSALQLMQQQIEGRVYGTLRQKGVV